MPRRPDIIEVFENRDVPLLTLRTLKHLETGQLYGKFWCDTLSK